MKKLALIFCLLYSSQLAFGSALSDAANAMAPGTWVQFTTNGFNAGAIFRPPAGGSVLQYQDRGSWNPINQTVMILGGAHVDAGSPDCSATLFVKYTESNNTWSSLTSPCPSFDNAFSVGTGHDYNHDTVNTNTGDFYHRQYSSGKVMKFSHSGQSWSQCSARPGNQQVAGALEYFPERNSLVYLDGDWGVHELSLASGNCLGTWVQIASTIGGGFSPQLTGLTSYHNVSKYSPACQCIIMGGNSPTLYKYNSNGTFTNVATAPENIGIPDAFGGSIMTLDPGTGSILAWTGTTGTARVYTPGTNVWTTTGIDNPLLPTSDGRLSTVVAIPILSYNVVMFVHAASSSGGPASVWLYKHSTTASDTENPTTPTSLSATPVSSTTINLSWTASTDNVAVTGYRVERCTGSACSSFVEIGQPTTTSYPDSGLTASTTYRYRVRAVDPSNNFSGYSTIVNATTSAADTTNPSTPTGFSATTTSSSTINLAWTASTDNIAVAGYRVERCTGVSCTGFAEISQPVTNSYSDSGLTAATVYGYRVRAVDTSTNFSGYSSTATATTNAATGGSDFSARCAAAGVVRCFGFDIPDDFPDFAPGAGNNRCWGCNFGVGPNGTNVNIPTLDTTVKASGAGSMKFVQPAGGGAAAAGNWFTNLSADKTFQLNEGGEVYIQYRWRGSSELINSANWPGSDGFKVIDFSAGDNTSCSTTLPNTTNCPGSCTEVEIVTQNVGKEGFPKIYAGCSGPEAFAGYYKMTSGTYDIHPNWTGTPTRSCLYPGPYTEPNCLNFAPNEWMTFKLYVKVGTWKNFDSTVKLWGAREGQPMQLILHCGPGVTCSDKLGVAHNTGAYFHNNVTNSLRLGKIWLLPYQTALSSGAVNASVWYDDLIISTQDIADPSDVEGGVSLVPTISSKRRRK